MTTSTRIRKPIARGVWVIVAIAAVSLVATVVLVVLGISHVQRSVCADLVTREDTKARVGIVTSCALALMPKDVDKPASDDVSTFTLVGTQGIVQARVQLRSKADSTIVAVTFADAQPQPTR
jgi:hypothetical protein